MSRRLTWRLAGQYNKLEEYLNGSVTLPFAPELRPSDRVRFCLAYGERTRVIEVHVEARTHSLHREKGGTTTLQFSRGLDQELYRDPAYFVEGLEQVDMSSVDRDAVQIQDGL